MSSIPLPTVELVWATVKARYPSDALVTLTNRTETGGDAIDDDVGEAAATSFLSLWPAYAQVEFDETNSLHLEAATFGVIAVLWRRGGTALETAKVEWDDVFGAEGILAKIKRTDPRSHRGPASNSDVARRIDTGGPYVGWSDRAAHPDGTFPRRRRSY